MESGGFWFLVCAKETFWILYQSQEAKHFYEVIPRDTPCKLYFDLEFMIALNPSKNGHLMTERLISLVINNNELDFIFSGDSINVTDIVDQIFSELREASYSKSLFNFCLYQDFPCLFKYFSVILILGGRL